MRYGAWDIWCMGYILHEIWCIKCGVQAWYFNMEWNSMVGATPHQIPSNTTTKHHHSNTVSRTKHLEAITAHPLGWCID
jgi:hypothetical protein